MDNFNVPKKINRNVMKALSVLQATHFITAFVPAQTIVHQVSLQMRYNKPINNLEQYVLKSLCSLTHLGIVVRTGPSEFALRQALEFNNGVSAIPWRLPPQPKPLKRARSAKKLPTKRTSLRGRPKSAIVKGKAKKSKTLPKPTRRSIIMASTAGKSSPVQLKQCVVLCSNILMKRQNANNNPPVAAEPMDCEVITEPQQDPVDQSVANSRYQFSAPISLIGPNEFSI